MENDTPPQPDARYEGTDSGRVFAYQKIAYIGAKSTITVEQTDSGFIVGGERFVPIEDTIEKP